MSDLDNFMRMCRVAKGGDTVSLTKEQAVNVHDEIDRLRARLDEREGQEPVATLLKSDPFDERDGPSFSLADWDRMRALPAYTKLYKAPPAAVPEGLDLEAVEEMLMDYESALRTGELDGAGRHFPSAIEEQAQLIDSLSAAPQPNNDEGETQ